MAHGRHDAERRAAEGGAHLGDQFLEGIFLGAVGAAVVAVEARRMPGRMTEFMQRGAVPIDRLEIGLRRRDLHIVFGRRVEGAIAADAKVDAGGLDQRFDRRLDQARRRWRRRGCDLVGQILALVGVEDGKTLEERDGLRLFAGLGRAPLLVVGTKRSA